MHASQKLLMTRPCSLHWDDLETTEGGRNCKKCNKLIVDFSESTQDEIHAAYQNSTSETGEFCGRFKVSQLLHAQRPKFTWRKSVMRRFALSVMLVFGAFLFNLSDTKANAYLDSIRSVADQTFDGGGAADSTSVKHKIVGTVSDSLTGEPLIGATVILEYGGEVYGASTDIDGQYVLYYNYVPSKDSVQVKYSVKYIGLREYNRTTVNLEPTSQVIDVTMQKDLVKIDFPHIYCMGEVQAPKPIQMQLIPLIEIEPAHDADWYRTEELEFRDDS